MCVCSKYVHVCVSTHECVLGVHVWYVVPCIVCYRCMCTYYVCIYVSPCVYGVCTWVVCLVGYVVVCELYTNTCTGGMHVIG